MLTVRGYRPEDRAAMRAICADTAFYGRPVEAIFPDRELVADALLDYFLNHEPQSCFVAADDRGRAVGYLVGTLNSHREWRHFLWHTVPHVALMAVCRLHVFRPCFWCFMWAGAKVAPARRRAMQKAPMDGTATLHVDFAESARNQGAGSKLLETFFDYARANGVHEIAISVATDGGKHFFAKHGFEKLAAHPAPRLAPKGAQPDEVWIMGKHL